MIKLKQIYIKDFMSIKEAKIRFSHTGLYFISGYDEAGGDSNGAGKSSILAAICWVIFGKTQKGLTGNQVVRWGTKNSTDVILHMDDGEHVISIRRTPTITELSINGAKVKGLKLDVQAQINETLHTDYNTFVSCIMFTRGQVDFLTDSGDAAKKKLFKNILGLERLDEAYLHCKEKLDNHKLQVDKMEHERQLVEQTLMNVINDIHAHQKMETNEAKERVKEVTAIKQLISLLKPPAEPTQENFLRVNSRLHLLEKQDYPTQYEKAYKEKQIIMKEQLADLARLEDSRHALQILWNLEDDTRCYTCGSDLTPEGKLAYANELKTRIKEGEKSQNTFKKLMERIDNTIEEISKNINEIHQLEKSLMSLEYEQKTYEQAKESYEIRKKEYEERIIKIESEKPQFKEILDNLNNTKITVGETLEIVIRELKKHTTAIDYYSYLYWMFSRTGVVSYIVDRSFGRLQTLTNRFLKNVARAGFTIEISPQKELKSGKVTDNITISVITNDKKVSYDNLSAGQQQRINVSLLMAIFIWSREVGANKFDFMLLDEVLDLSLAEQGQKDMVEFVGNMLKHINQIVVISHRDTIPDKSYKEIKVRRNLDGISEIEGG